MKNFFSNLKYRLQQGMQGRYGNDELNRFLSIAAIVCFVIAILQFIWSPLYYAWYLGLVLLIFQIFRSFSKNTYQRSKERDWFLGIRSRLSGEIKFQKKKWDQRGTSRFFRCPKCRQAIRVPKGRGRIEITCPKCGTKFVKKS